MTNKIKGGDDDSFDFSKFGFNKRGSGAPNTGGPKTNTGGAGNGNDSGEGDPPVPFDFSEWEPEPSDEDLAAARNESEKMFAAEIENDLESAFRSIADKIIWDIVLTLVRPDAMTLQKMINEIIQRGNLQVVSEIHKESEGMDKEDREFMVRVLRAALVSAEANFRKAFSRRDISDEFAAAVIKSVRKNLKK